MKLTSKLITAILFCTLLAGSASAQGRIATIDLRKVFDNFWRTKQAQANLKEQAADMDKERKSLVDDFTKAQDDYKKIINSANDAAISNEERDKRKASAEKKLLEIRELEQTVQQYDRQATTTIGEKQKRMRENILKEIREVVNAKAKASNFALVVDTAADSINNTPVVLFTSGENDITDSVLSQLNLTTPAELPKTDEKAAPPAKNGKK
jgi:outer membrane protein